MRFAIAIAAFFFVLQGTTHAQVIHPLPPAPFVPPALQVSGTNGFKVYVFPTSRYSPSHNSVSVTVVRGPTAITYVRNGSVTRNSMMVDLKKFGFIDVRFDPSGRTKSLTQPGPCGAIMPIRLGSFHGEIRFQGRRGYTKVDAARARVSAPPSQSPDCLVSGFGGGALTGFQSGTGGSATYFAKRPAGSAPTVVGYLENVNERGINAVYRVATIAPSTAFIYSRDGGSLVPGPPFTGRADYAVSGVCRNSTVASGTLAVELPGGRRVSLLGPGFRHQLFDSTPDPNPDPNRPICPA